jgi:hypothetical protein
MAGTLEIVGDVFPKRELETAISGKFAVDTRIDPPNHAVYFRSSGTTTVTAAFAGAYRAIFFDALWNTGDHRRPLFAKSGPLKN